MAYVLKIKYENTLRRVVVKPHPVTGEVDLSYELLKAKIQDLFGIPSSLDLVLTYKDKDEDVVTIAQDEDIEDALVIQGLNPLRIDVNNRNKSSAKDVGNSTSVKGQGGSAPAIDIASVSQMVEKALIPTIDSLKNIASGHMNNLSEKLEQDGKFSSNILSEVLQALGRAHTRDNKVTPEPKERSVNSSPSSKEAGDCSDPFSDPTAEFKPPNPPPSSPLGPSIDGVFHHGVQCDLCGMIPIVGPRFKSLRKDDYDLCLTCFTDSKSAEADYLRYDQPFRFHGGRQFSGIHGGKMSRCPYFQPSIFGRPFGSRSGFYGSHGRHEGRGYNHNTASGKLDCRFVKDVTISDGTEFTPGTSFTKIWRLRNSGSLPWPQNTQLVCVGGDELGSVPFALLELPEGGLLPDNEIEVSVDLLAPEHPGRYISHWRLMSPSGVKFGHRVWVSIQVVTKREDSQALDSLKVEMEEESQQDGGLDSEIPREVESTGKSDEIPVTLTEANAQIPSAPLVDVVEAEELTPKTVVENAEKYAVEQYASEPVNLENSELGAFSLIDVPKVVGVEMSGTNETSKAPSEVSSFDVELLPVSWKVEAVQPVQPELTLLEEQTLLNHLATIGFTDTILNQDLLAKHNNDLQLVLDNLFAAEKWDPMLAELREMGFTDMDLNLRLMFKHNGSVKRVVKELVQIYKSKV